MTTRADKICQLRRIISQQLDGLIGRNYVLLGLPYYLNIGDILIWEGERQYLKSLGLKCLNTGYRYSESLRIKKDTLIILQGGGNFGDLWRCIQDDRVNIIQRYPNNPIIITPVTCWYEDITLLRQDAQLLSKHDNLTICARDAFSEDLLNKHFNNRTILVPDMAFCIEPSTLRSHVCDKGSGTLFLKRIDKELATEEPSLPKEILGTADIHDWPSIENEPTCWINYRKICECSRRLARCRGFWRVAGMASKMSDWYYHAYCRKELIREGAHFVGQYQKIYTTRLHGGILSILLDKDVAIIDNSYGKNARFFDTWLRDTDGVSLWGSA